MPEFPFAALMLVLAATAQAQTPAPAAAASAPAPAPARGASAPAGAASAPPARPAAAAATDPQRVEITGGRLSDVEERRRSTASKIIIGREEIDKFGDATVGEVLRRLPGVTTPGAPGRGGPPRMRGLGNGYTQLLIDGQRIPPGFSLESLTPEQIERIEVLRAPTAETGSRAIAGTINIITREGFRRRLNDLRLGFGYENGKFSPGVNWTHNDAVGELTYNLSGSAFQPHRKSSNETRTTVASVDDGTLLEDRTARSTTREDRFGLNFTSRLQWRLGGEGSSDLLSLMPSVFHSEGRTRTDFSQDKTLTRVCLLVSCADVRYDSGNTVGDSRFTNARLNGQWRQRFGAVRLELGGGGGSYEAVGNSLRTEYQTGRADPSRRLEDHTLARESSGALTLKASGLAGGDDKGGEHSLVAGGEVDASRRNESRVSLQDGVNLLTDFGDNLQASALRVAAYAQDEWNIDPNWGAHAGLRWEGIRTQGDTGDQSGADAHPTNRSSVVTPLLHAIWKPDPKGRDQVRMSLTRSYRSPPLSSLIARPSINRDYDPTLQSNTETSPDSAGNPKLEPELATGVDVAVERYLESGGILSANLFHREISNLMRNRTTLETVSYSKYPRWVRRQQNIGDATTSGIELEAKFRLDQLLAGATPVEVHGNAAFFDSKVRSVPGPDNRLDQQARSTTNLGADYRLRGLPLTLGGNFNWVPGYTTKLDIDQFVTVSTKRIWDLYALWTFNPAAALRLLGSNLDPHAYTNTTQDDAINTAVVPAANERTTVRSTGPSYVNWQLRLELKL